MLTAWQDGHEWGRREIRASGSMRGTWRRSHRMDGGTGCQAKAAAKRLLPDPPATAPPLGSTGAAYRCGSSSGGMAVRVRQ